ncbi:hypothetical protein COCVIDRAFT_99349, partial [Bipolaris victoriae FI3]
GMLLAGVHGVPGGDDIPGRDECTQGVAGPVYVDIRSWRPIGHRMPVYRVTRNPRQNYCRSNSGIRVRLLAQ